MDNPAQTMVDLLTRGETIVAFLIFIVPGFISLRTYEVIRGGEPRKINESLIQEPNGTTIHVDVIDWPTTPK